MTTFGATTTAPITIPGTTPTTDCEEGQQDCAGETEAPDDYDMATGKRPKLGSFYYVIPPPCLFGLIYADLRKMLQCDSEAKQWKVKMLNVKKHYRKDQIIE